MGVLLMTNRTNYSIEERKNIRDVITRRSWFLFVLGVAFYLWWPADILHFYGGYMHMAVLIIFLPKKYYLYGALFAILAFHFFAFSYPV